MSSFQNKLGCVWVHSGSLDGDVEADKTARYVPKAIGDGPSWQVYDMQEQRFLTDRQIKKMPLETLRDEKLQVPS